MTTQRPMRFNNCDYNGLAHAWAYNHERDLRTGCDRMHTRGNTLYSYSTAIAYKIVDKQVLLLAREGFSVTTQKQKRAIRRAFGHWNIIEVNSDNIPEYDVSLERLLKKEVEECKHRLKYMLDNTRKNKQGVFARFEDRHDFCGYVDTLRRLGDAFGKRFYNTHTKRHSKLEKYVLILEDYQESIVENREQARRERIRKEFEERVKRNEEAMNLFHQELGCAVKDVKFSKLIDAFATSCLPCHLSLHILREYFNVDDSYLRCWISNTETNLKDIKEQSSPKHILKECLAALDKCEIQEKIIKEQDYWISQFMHCFINNTVLKDDRLRKVHIVVPNYTNIGRDVVTLLQYGINTRGFEFEEFVDITPETYEYVISDRNHKLFNYLKER